jgi:hypothetical protein
MLGTLRASFARLDPASGKGNGDGLESVKKTDQVASVGMGTRFADRPRFKQHPGDTNPASV